MSDEISLQKVPAGSPEVPYAIPIPAYAMEQEDSEEVSLLEYWRILRKRRWTVLSILLLVFVTVLIGTLKQRPVYRSKAVLEIDNANPNILSFKDVFELDTSNDDYLETSYKVLHSRSLARRVIDKLHLDQVPEFTSERSLSIRALVSGLWKKNEEPTTDVEKRDSKREGLVDNFLSRLAIDPVRRSRLVEISFDSYDPLLSAQIVNTLTSNFIDENLEVKWDATQKASDWLSQQLVGLKARLEKSDEDLQRYAKDNSILFLDEKQSMTSQKLKDLQEEATRAQADLAQKESQYNQIKGGDLTYIPGILENKLYQDLSVKLADLNREYSELIASFTPEYPKVKRLKNQIDEVEKTLKREQGAFARKVTDEYKASVNRKRLLDDAVAQQTKEFNQIAEKSIQFNILKREADTNKQLYEGLLQRVKEASISAGLRASNVRVVDQGEVPTSPAKPRFLLNLALALVGGLGLGVGIAFFQEYLDNTLKTPEDVQRYLHLSALGVIPAANSSNGKGKLPYGYGYGEPKALPLVTPGGNGKPLHPELIGAKENSQLSEAYRSLRTSVLLSTSGRPPRVILVTSGQPGEGKTTTAVNLAIALGQLGGKVLLIDSDMRRPRVASLLKMPPSSRGLSTYLTGQFTVDEVIADTQIPNLFAIPCGPIPPNPAELLSSEQMACLLRDVPEKFNYVLLDSPPTLHVSDARILAGSVDAVVLVAHGGGTPREVVNHARLNLLHVNANLIGVVLNNVDFSSVGYEYYYRYYHGYAKGYGYGYTASGSGKEGESAFPDSGREA